MNGELFTEQRLTLTRNALDGKPDGKYIRMNKYIIKGQQLNLVAFQDVGMRI